jgi:hypothetical protein
MATVVGRKTKRVIEKWLDEGWSPARVIWALIALISTAVFAWGFVAHPHHPGAVWWLVGVLLVAASWFASEAGRWRIRHDRLVKKQLALPPPIKEPSIPLPSVKVAAPANALAAFTGDDPSLHSQTSSSELKEVLLKELEKGMGLQSRLPGPLNPNIWFVAAATEADVIEWEDHVQHILKRHPRKLIRFQAPAKTNPLTGAALNPLIEMVTTSLARRLAFRVHNLERIIADMD